MERTNWVDRKFNFGIPEGWMPNTVARLDGAVPRLKSITESLAEDKLIHKPNGSWSIKEHLGHLIDLEDLHIGRILDFAHRKKMLRAADMSNKKTNEASHNEQGISKLLNDFKNKRNAFINALKNLDDESQRYVSNHPRLKEKMKPVDIAFFTAEHDDHHIASIYQIIEPLE